MKHIPKVLIVQSQLMAEKAPGERNPSVKMQY